MHSIGVIGDKDSIMGFKAVGFSVYEAYTEQETVKIVSELADNGYVVIYITEQLAAKVQPLFEKYAGMLTPAIIPVPGSKAAWESGPD